jgi:hypothetical protein
MLTYFFNRYILYTFVVDDDNVEGGGGDVSVYLWSGEGWFPVQEEGGITLGQVGSQALVQVSDSSCTFKNSI